MPSLDKIRISWATCFATGLMLLLLPLQWCFAMALAAAVHELCHIACVIMLGGKVLNIRLGFGGAVIETDIRGRFKTLLCCLAGPVGALSILFFARILPRTALCVLIQSAFNLLPVYPLDGGKALRCILEAVFRKNSLQRRLHGCTIE